LWEQNQDSLAAVEYSIDEGATWLPIVYLLDGPDIVRDGGGNVNAVATFNTMRVDIASYFDPGAGETRGGFYGAFIGAPVSADLAPFVSARVNDDPVESKRVELFRLPMADNQPKVRLRFAHAGTDSWYFGIDNVGLYSIPVVTPPLVNPLPDQTAAVGNSATFLAVASGVGPFTYQWRFNGMDLPGQTAAALTIPNVQPSDAGRYTVVVRNAGGPTESAPGRLNVIRPLAIVTGQWDFQNGDLSATCGHDLEFFDEAVQAATEFGTTTSFGIPDIAGQPASVMKFPFLQPMNGYRMRHGIAANGAGSYVNQYTLILDVLYPAASHDQWRAFLQTSADNPTDAEFYANPANGIGISGVYDGQLQADTWHRVAFAVDLSGPGPSPIVAKFIDGVKVGEQVLGGGTDGRWSLYTADDPATPWALLFAEPAGFTQAGYVSSVQIRGGRLSDAALAAMGGPSAEKIPGAVCVEVEGNNVIIHWSGSILESADQVSGPWNRVINAAKPYVVPTPLLARKFYRSR
jgi:hypothetical protein